ncbi:MAG: Natural resistance-associated macrophage protein, partial [Candidatus Gottesmanbacteria bacterium GW2011_GWC2_39_8]
LAKKLTEAKVFYFTIAAATLIGLAINLLRINAIAALYYAAIVNGIIAVPLIFIIIRLANDKRIVGEFKSKPIIKASSWAAFILMGLAVVLMMVQILIQLLPSIRFS